MTPQLLALMDPIEDICQHDHVRFRGGGHRCGNGFTNTSHLSCIMCSKVFASITALTESRRIATSIPRHKAIVLFNHEAITLISPTISS